MATVQEGGGGKMGDGKEHGGENDFTSDLFTMPLNLTDMPGGLVEEGSLLYRLPAGFCGVAQERIRVTPLQGWAVVLEDLNIASDNYS